MKERRDFILLAILIVGMCFAGCALSNSRQKDMSSKGTDSYLRDGDVVMEESTEPDNFMSVNFETYEELEEWFILNEQGIAPAMEEMELHGEFYQAFVSDMLSGRTEVMKPYWGNRLMELRKDTSLFTIAISCWDGERASIWYFCKIDNMDCRVQVTYLSEEEMMYAQEHTIGEIREELYPSTISMEEMQNSDRYKDMYMYMEEITLSDRTVSALCVVYAEHDIVYKVFMYDDLYVQIVGNAEVHETADWSMLSLRAE